MLKKKEIVWREILYQSLENKVRQFTQKKLAERFSISLNTVFHALKVPRASGAIEVKGRFFLVRDLEKLLNLWATFRNLKKDIIYQTHIDGSVQTSEANVPSKVIFTAFSAYRLKFNEAPADYDKVYFYSDDLAEIKKRFPPKKGYVNLIVLKPDKFLLSYGLVAPLPQIYVDLWNLPEWYAKEFLNALKNKIF